MKKLGCAVLSRWLFNPISTFSRSPFQEARSEEKLALEAVRSADDQSAVDLFQRAAAAYRKDGRSDREESVLQQLSAIYSRTSNYDALSAVLSRRLELAEGAHNLTSAAILVLHRFARGW